MNKPPEKVAGAAAVNVFVVCAPGTDPARVNVIPNLIKLGWKLGEVPAPDLIDQIKQADDYLKALEKWVEGARGILKQRLPVPALPGEETVTRGVLFEAHYVKSTRTAMDQEKVKAYLADAYPQYCKTTEVLTLKIVPVTQTPGTAG